MGLGLMVILGLLRAPSVLITEMAKAFITPYMFQVQERSTASPLKEYLTPWQVCLHIFSSLLITFCIMQILPLVLSQLPLQKTVPAQQRLSTSFPGTSEAGDNHKKIVTGQGPARVGF